MRRPWSIEQERKLFSASDVAKLCAVDLKTIHNWVERGCIRHFRTPGRHLRFQAVDVVHFLREWGYAIPRAIHVQVARTVVLVGTKDAAASVSRALGSSVSLQVVEDPIQALLHIGAEPTRGVVIDAGIAHESAQLVGSSIAALRRAFSDLPIVLWGDDVHGLAATHGVVVVPESDGKLLRAALSGEPDIREAPSKPTGKRAARAVKPA